MIFTKCSESVPVNSSGRLMESCTIFQSLKNNYLSKDIISEIGITRATVYTGHLRNCTGAVSGLQTARRKALNNFNIFSQTVNEILLFDLKIPEISPCWVLRYDLSVLEEGFLSKSRALKTLNHLWSCRNVIVAQYSKIQHPNSTRF